MYYQLLYFTIKISSFPGLAVFNPCELFANYDCNLHSTKQTPDVHVSVVVNKESYIKDK